MIPTVKQLRQSGYKVRVIHSRNFEPVKGMSSNSQRLSAKGGATTIEITTPDGKNVSGIALCSKQDSYNKKLGAQIAIGRALSQLS
jgi:hypothetical protein